MQSPSERENSTRVPIDVPSGRRRILIAAGAILLLIIAAVLISRSLRKFPDNPAAMQKAAESIVQLECFAENDEPYCTGTAVAAFSDGIFITNYHVIKEGVTKIVAHTVSGTMFELNHILAYDAEKDIAILSTEISVGIPPLTVGDGDSLSSGDRVAAIGSPLGFTNATATGVFSGYYRSVDRTELRFHTDLPYGSTGALFNDRGEVIGVTCGTYGTVQSGNVAIPISFVDELLQKVTAPIPIGEFEDGFSDPAYTVDYTSPNRGFSNPEQIYSTLTTNIVPGYRLQSCAYDSKRDRYGVAFIATNRQSSSKFCIVDRLDDFSDAIVSDIDLGHANDMTYDPVNDRFVVASHRNADGSNTGGVAANSLTCVSPINGAIISRMYPSGVSLCSAVEFYDNAYIIYNEDTGWFHRMSLDGSEVKPLFKSTKNGMRNYFGRHEEGLYCQGMVIRDDVIYRLLAVKNDGRIDTALLIGINFDGDFVSKQSFSVSTNSEAEGIVLQGNELYIVTSSSFYSVYRAYWDELNSDKFLSTLIPESSDLDTYLADGKYFSNTKANTQTLRNLPNDNINTGFTLTVEQQGSDSKRQWLVPNGKTAVLYTRYFDRSAGTWGPWIRFDGTVLN